MSANPHDVSLFDPQMFLDAEVTGEMSTKYVDVEAGRYNMVVDSLTLRRVIPDDPTERPYTFFEAQCVIDGNERQPSGATIKEATGRDQIKARYKGFADFNEAGSLDLGKGRNVAIGALRAAVNQNLPGVPWKLNMLKGQMFNGELVLVPDKKNPDRKYAEVRNPLPRQ